MNQFPTLEATFANLLRVYQARNEHDLVTLVQVAQQLLGNVRILEERVQALEARHPRHTYIEDRAAYLGLGRGCD